MSAKLIAYYRVSTKEQGESGLGLEAQTAAVEAYAKGIGATILRSYREVETGKRSDRPELTKALTDAKRSKATLCIAKLDRLARNVAFTANLMESGVEFVACDNPHANRLTIHILAAVAEDEAKRISDRTKAALAAYKCRGGSLGAHRPNARRLKGGTHLEGARKGAMVSKALADDAYADLKPSMVEWRSAGLSLRGIASKLNSEGHTTRRGQPWNAMQVKRVLERTS
jgi:DNA invertase Pin-like site-specific DNA recombinase